MKILKLALVALAISVGYTAQAQYVSNGKIEYEKRANIKLQFKNEMPDMPMPAEILNQLPSAFSSFYDLYFDATQTKMTYNRDTKLTGMAAQFADQVTSKEDVLYTNLETRQRQFEKKLFEAKYLIQEPTPTYTWKIEDEIRVIANFNCRKATTMIDSMVVVAFYTDEITTPGGPEGITGLPGMILGLAVPQIYTTWFATKVELIQPTKEQLAPPTKGKKTTTEGVITELSESMKKWGKMAEFYTKGLRI